jgi:hypothetical protein
MKKITLLIALLAFSLGYAQPTTSATTPTKLAADVSSVFSDAYTNLATVQLFPDWGQGTTYSNYVVPASSPTNNVIKYTNLDYQGINLVPGGNPPGLNLSAFTHLHFDVWTPNVASFKISLIDGTGETALTLNPTQSGWNSYDIVLATSYPTINKGAIRQFKFEKNPFVYKAENNTFYIDNIYFWKAPTAAGANADLTDLKVSGVSLPGFTIGSTTNLYELQVGTTVVPQVTAVTKSDPNATAVITQATSIPGTASVLVTSQNGLVTKTYSVSFTATLPNPAPNPTTPDAQVLSIFGDTGGPTGTGYTTKYPAADYFGTNQGTPDLDLSPSVVNTAIKMDFSKAGWGGGIDGSSYRDLTTYGFLHFDYFAENTTPGVNGDDVRFIIIGPAPQEYNYILKPTGGDGVLVKGSWQSVNIPLSFFTAKGFNKTQFRQFKLGSLSDLNSKVVYFDNIYFSVNNPALSTESFESSKVRMYPNPAKNTLNIDANNTIEKVAVYSILGQEVLSKKPNNNSTTLQTSGLQRGTYIVRSTIGGKTSTSKFIKE